MAVLLVTVTEVRSAAIEARAPAPPPWHSGVRSQEVLKHAADSDGGSGGAPRRPEQCAAKRWAWRRASTTSTSEPTLALRKGSERPRWDDPRPPSAPPTTPARGPTGSSAVVGARAGRRRCRSAAGRPVARRARGCPRRLHIRVLQTVQRRLHAAARASRPLAKPIKGGMHAVLTGVCGAWSGSAPQKAAEQQLHPPRTRLGRL